MNDHYLCVARDGRVACSPGGAWLETPGATLKMSVRLFVLSLLPVEAMRDHSVHQETAVRIIPEWIIYGRMHIKFRGNGLESLRFEVPRLVR